MVRHEVMNIRKANSNMSGFWKGRSVLVTGASGLLGSHVTRLLLERSAEVTVLLRDWIPQSPLVMSADLSRVRSVRGCLEDYLTVLRAVNEHEVDTIFHLGAQTIVGTASRSVISTFQSNVVGTMNILEAARICSSLVKRIVVASSDKAYGAHPQLPYTEDVPLQGRFPYDASKVCAEILCQSYFHSFHVPVAITRCGNLYGGGDLNWNRLIPGTIRSVFDDQPPIIRSDGNFVRDYFYVEDAAGAYLLLAEKLEQMNLTGEAFNFGPETPMTVLDVVARILARMGRQDLEPVIKNEASLEIRDQFLDCTKARTRLGWKPVFTFDEGLDRTIAWYRDLFRTRIAKPAEIFVGNPTIVSTHAGDIR
jgi:CDP-glucose 4,6-dehydratase